jgi:hypothetical protein
MCEEHDNFTSLASKLVAVTGGGSLVPRATASCQGNSGNICGGVWF